MKRPLIFCVFLCALLCGCQSNNAEQPTDSSLQTEEKPSTDTTVGEDDAQTRLTYYEGLVTDLRAELLELKISLFSERVEYESRIEALETELKAVERPPSAPSDEVETVAPESEFRYTVSDGKVILTAYVGERSEVVIPNTLGGYPVVAVGDRAFLNQTAMTSVTIPDGVLEIGWFAFSGCVSLETVAIPNSVRAISYGAFQNCDMTLTVFCASGSYAEAYAQSYGMRLKRTQ